MPTDVSARIAQLIDELFGVPADALADDVTLQDGLQLDSLSVIELQTAVEDAFDIRFEDDDAATVTTVGDLVQAVEDALRRKARTA